MTPEVHHLVAASFAVLGHLALWTGAFSRLHALGLRMRLLHLCELPIFAMLLGLPAAVLLRWILAPPLLLDLESWLPGGPAGWFYFWWCSVWGVVTILTWSWRKWKSPPPQFLSCHSQIESIAERLGHLPCRPAGIRWLARLPGNQILDLETSVKTLLVPRLPPGLDGLTIVHMSDIHFTGHLTEDFFHFVVDRVNELDSDLVALTGDIMDEPSCLGWIGQILGRVQSHWGAFCILGNHDLRIRDRALLAGEFEQAGWHYLGGRWLRMRIRGQDIVLAGNELPWYRPAADMSTCPPPVDGRGELRILLSHSPDQIQWARRHGFDLMLSGHTHGGQIQLPVIGPLIGQSRYGVRYCCGVFSEPPTLLHVSRGVSAKHNLRINCRPELIKLVLKCGMPLPTEDRERANSALLSPVPVPAAVSRS